MPEATANKTPELIGALTEINQQLKYYCDLNAQLSQIGHRFNDTTSQLECVKLTESLPRPSGLLTELQDVSNILAIQNTSLQDTINKLNGLI